MTVSAVAPRLGQPPFARLLKPDQVVQHRIPLGLGLLLLGTHKRSFLQARVSREAAGQGPPATRQASHVMV